MTTTGTPTPPPPSRADLFPFPLVSSAATVIPSEGVHHYLCSQAPQPAIVTLRLLDQQEEKHLAIPLHSRNWDTHND